MPFATAQPTTTKKPNISQDIQHYLTVGSGEKGSQLSRNPEVKTIAKSVDSEMGARKNVTQLVALSTQQSDGVTQFAGRGQDLLLGRNDFFKWLFDVGGAVSVGKAICDGGGGNQILVRVLSMNHSVYIRIPNLGSSQTKRLQTGCFLQIQPEEVSLPVREFLKLICICLFKLIKRNQLSIFLWVSPEEPLAVLSFPFILDALTPKTVSPISSILERNFSIFKPATKAKK